MSTSATQDSKTLLLDELRQGIRCMGERVFYSAAHYFHSASWIAARAGLRWEQLDAVVKLADALLHARQFTAALANYRFAQRLAEEHFPDSPEYWITRACAAQALRRIERYREARTECEAVRSRVDKGLSDPAKQALLDSVLRNLEAQLESIDGNYARAADISVTLGREFGAAGDHSRAGMQYFNAALWASLAASKDGADGGEMYSESLDNLSKAILLLSSSSVSEKDEKLRETELLHVLIRLIGVRIVDAGGEAGGKECDELLDEASTDLARIASATDSDSPQTRFQELFLAMRIAERRSDEAETLRCRRALASLAAEHRAKVADWVKQSLATRFSWQEAVSTEAATSSILAEILPPVTRVPRLR